MYTGAGTEVDDIVGSQYCFFIVLDDDNCVASVAQVNQCVEQPLIVALVQADRRLVENVHDADESRADLAGQADALRLAT